MVADYFAAEFSKLVKRPASWVLGSVQVLALVLFGYLFTYAFVANAQNGGEVPGGVNVDQALQTILPENVLVTVVANLSGLGGALALVFGAMVVGGEYGWGTLKLVLSQRPGRLNMLLGKFLAVGAVLAVLSVVILLIAVLSSAVASSLLDEPSDWPSLGEMLKGLGASWLVLFAWASLGGLLAVVFRGTALAIGVGLAYALVIEGLALSLPIGGDAFDGVRKVFLGKNTTDLTSAFGELPQGVGTVGEAVDPGQAVIVIVAYTAAFLAISALLFRRRDV